MKDKITENQITEEINNSLQYISYYHSPDFILAMTNAYKKENNIAAKNAIKQILINSKMCAIGKRPLCQDTGIVNVFLEIGLNCQFINNFDLEKAINQGVRLAYSNPENPLRASIVSDPIFTRPNTKDNAPAVIYSKMVTGDKIKITVAAKGCGSENKAKFSVLDPDENIVDWVLQQLPKMGAGWCPPGIIGIGVGGTAEKAMLMAKQALMENIDIVDIRNKKTPSNTEKMRIELVDKINNLGIGAQGLGGLTTVLDVKIKDYPTHAASKPVALIANCAATRHISFNLGDELPIVDMNIYPDLSMDYTEYKKINLDNLNKKHTKNWNIGDSLLLSGTIYTARDKAHVKLQQMLTDGEKLPIDFTNKFIYYVGPVNKVGTEIIGPAGPTTATRMDKFSKSILSTNCLGAIGKAERGKSAIVEFKQQQAVYLIAVGGAAYLISKAIKEAKVVAFAEFGMEAIYQLKVENMPVMVAVDSSGNNIHQQISF